MRSRIRQALRARLRTALPTEQEKYLADIWPRLEPYTQLLEQGQAALMAQVDDIARRQVPGTFVECGVWKGGASFMMLRRLADRWGRDDPVWMFDSWEGHPTPEPIDGPKAAAVMADVDGPWYYDNSRCSVADVEAAAAELGVRDRIRPVKGWFEVTMPAAKATVGPIALLRIDADWYTSVRTCLNELYDQVVPGGIVAIDDYYAFDGCTLAVHEFLTERQAPHAIVSAGGTAYFVKERAG